MTSQNCFISGAEENNNWSIFLGANLHNRVCWGMVYLTKEKGKYYEETFSSTYGGHPWGPSFSVCKNEVTESNASDDVRQIIEADQQGQLAELIRHKSYIVFDSPYFDFGAFEYLRIPEVLLKRLNEMDPKVPEPPKKKSEEELLQEMVQQSKCVYTTLSLHPINPTEDYRTISTYYLSPTNTIIKANEYSGISSNGFYTSLSFSYESMSSEKLATEIAHTARVDELTPHFTGKLIRVLESVNLGKNSIEMGFTRHAIMFAEGKYVLHRFQAQVATEGNGRPITYFSETVYPFTTENIDEITPKTFEKLRTEVAIFQEDYSEDGVLITPLDDSWSQLMPTPQSFVSGYDERHAEPIGEEHEKQSVSEQSQADEKSVDTLEMLMEIVEKEDLSVLICSHEDRKRGFIFDHLQRPFKTFLRNFNGTYWDVYYENNSATDAENIHSFDNLQEACQKVLEYARASKKLPGMADAKTNHHLLYWALDESGILTLSGKGPMAKVSVPEYRIIDKEQLAFELEYGNFMLSENDVDSRATLPWDGKKVRKVIIEPGLTTVSFSTFSPFFISLNNCFFLGKYEILEEIILPDTIEMLEWNSISDCPALEKVVIPTSVTSIEENILGYVFDHCPKIAIHTPAGSYAEEYSKKHAITVVSHSVADKGNKPNSIFQRLKKWFAKLGL